MVHSTTNTSTVAVALAVVAAAVMDVKIGWRTLQDNSSLRNASEFESIRARLRSGEEEVQSLVC